MAAGSGTKRKWRIPERAERLWLAIAVATFWAVSVGGEADATVPVSSLEALPATHVARRKASGRTRPRMLSCFARGLLAIVGALIRGDWIALRSVSSRALAHFSPCSPESGDKTQGVRRPGRRRFHEKPTGKRPRRFPRLHRLPDLTDILGGMSKIENAYRIGAVVIHAALAATRLHQRPHTPPGRAPTRDWCVSTSAA